MNSFDFWDTLAARRFMRDEWHWRTRECKPDPKGFEFQNVIPIEENIAKVAHYDIVVSDYGDGTEEYHEFLVSLLARFGLTNRVFVTPGGKCEGTIWSTLKPKPDVHFGDNQRADVDCPTKAGIKGVLTVLSPLTEPEAFLRQKGFPNLALVCREARLTTFNSKYRGIELLQSDYNFPVLFLASVVLNRLYPDHTLLMSSRDCFMWVDLMQKLFRRGVYWYTSVIARTNADGNYHRNIQSFPNPLMVDLCGSGKSFAQLSQYPSVLLYKPLRGEPSIPSIITSEDCWRLEQANCAPHEKCVGIDCDLKPIFINKSKTDFAIEPNTAAQVNAFRVALTALDHYDLSQEMNAPTELCKEVMSHLMHKYVNFKEAVEPLRQLAIRDDA